MPKRIFRLSLFVVLLAFGGSIRGKEAVFIGTSMKTLAGLYRVTYGFAFFGHAISIAPNGTVTLKASGISEERFLNNLFFPGGIRGETHRPERFVVRDEMCLSKGLSHVVFSRRRASRRDCVHSAVGLAIRKKRLVLVIAARRFDGIFNADYPCSSDT